MKKNEDLFFSKFICSSVKIIGIGCSGGKEEMQKQRLVFLRDLTFIRGLHCVCLISPCGLLINGKIIMIQINEYDSNNTLKQKK